MSFQAISLMVVGRKICSHNELGLISGHNSVIVYCFVTCSCLPAIPHELLEGKDCLPVGIPSATVDPGGVLSTCFWMKE